MAPVTCALGSRISVGSLEARRTLGGTKISVSLKSEFTALFFFVFSLSSSSRVSNLGMTWVGEGVSEAQLKACQQVVLMKALVVLMNIALRL